MARHVPSRKPRPSEHVEGGAALISWLPPARVEEVRSGQRQEGRKERKYPSAGERRAPARSKRPARASREAGYLADESTALVSYLAAAARQAGAGRGPGRASARPSWPRRSPAPPGRKLIRLQCYEGLDEAKALYEWNYRKQLLRIQTEASDAGWQEVKDDIFGEEFLLRARCSPRSPTRSRWCC